LPDKGVAWITLFAECAEKETWTMNEQRFPKDWDEQRVEQLIAILDARTDEEWTAEDEAVYEAVGITMMAVPTELVPEVRALIARKHSA
jgi:predicted ATP-dependent serine protease